MKHNQIRSSILAIIASMFLFLNQNNFGILSAQAALQSVPVTIIQAESCILSGCSVGTYGYDYTGDGYVEYINQIGDGIQFSVHNFSSYSDYITISICYSQGHSTVQTLSLFVDSKFVKKISFEPTGAWDTTWNTVSVPIYAAGAGTVQLKYTSGDGDVDIDKITYYPFMSSTKMVIVPHEDDEILGFCGSIQSMIDSGDNVRVVLMTNGDANTIDGSHFEMGRERLRETVDALAHVGVSKDDVIVLGYSDGLLYDLYYTSTPNTVIPGPYNGITYTYGDIDNTSSQYGLYDYHFIQTGQHADYTRTNLLSDLTDVLVANHPTDIYTTSSYDTHPDHSTTYRLIDEAINAVHLTPLVHETIIHGTDDTNWPPRYTNYYPTPPTPTPFNSPFSSSYHPLDFNNATKLQLTSSMLANKYAAIGEFYTQNDYLGYADYNYAFYRSDEFYWTKDYSTMTYI